MKKLVASVNDDGIVYTTYSRVSTDRIEQQISKQYQDKELEMIGENYKRWVDSGLRYTDDGESATSVLKREGFKAMIRDAKDAQKFNLIIIREVSRFARYAKEFMIFIEDLHNNGVVVYFSDYNMLSNDINAPVILNLLATLAEQESNNKRRYTLKGHEVRRLQGFVFGADDKYGYDMIGMDVKGVSNQLVKNEEEAKVVRDIYNMYIYQNMGVRRIAKALNDRGVPTKKGSFWQQSNVSMVLHYKGYCGYVRYNTSVKESLHCERKKNRNKAEYIYVKSDNVEVIIDEETYDKAQELAKSRSKVTCTPVLDNSNQPIRDAYGNVINRSRGYKPINDIYAKKLQCECGCTFKKHHIRRPDANGNRPIGYTCYNYDNHIISETLGRVCSNKPFDKVKLDMMALKIFHGVWQEQRESIEVAYKLIISSYQQEIDNRPKSDKKKIETDLNKKFTFKNRLFSMVEEDTITDADFKLRIDKVNLEIEKLQNDLRIANEQEAEFELFDLKKEMDNIRESLSAIVISEMNVYGYLEINQDVINDFVNKIIVNSDGSFEWYLNLRGDCQSEFIKNKFDSKYRDRYSINNSALLISEFVIDYDEANEFVQLFGRRKFVFKRKDMSMIWRPIVARVYIE